MSKEKKNAPLKNVNSYARFSGYAIQMFAIISVGTFIGVKLDEAYPNEYDGYTISLALAAVLISIFSVIRQIISHSKK